MRVNNALVRAWVMGVLAGVYAPEPDEEIWEWAERTLRIPATENEEMAGQFWSASVTPYVKELMRWVKRPGKGEFWIRKSSQVGFTMAVLIIICWFIVHRSGNICYAVDTTHTAREISKTRLQKWISDNSLLETMGEDVDDLANLTYYLRNTTVYMIGAYSKGAWANKSIMLFILDELDKHPYIEGEGTTADLARERVKRPKNAKVIGFCTPGETDQITKEFEAGTQEELRLPCPHCRHMEALKWENFVFGTPEFKDLADGYDLEKVRQAAHFQCPACRGRIEERHKSAMLLGYQSVPMNAKAPANIRSMHIWDAYSPFVSFGDLAVEWLKAQGDPVKIERYIRGRRGEKYEKSGKALKHEDVLQLRAAYKRNVLPFRPHLLAMITDLQQDCQKSTKLAFNLRGDMFVVDWRITLDLDEIISFADEPVLIPGGEMFVTHALVDEGHRMQDVRRLCLANMPRFWPVKGRGGLQVRAEVGTSTQWCDGQEIITYHIDDDGFKWRLLMQIRDHKKLKEKGLPRLFLPENVIDDAEFVDELTNEHPERRKNELGREVWKWIVPKGKSNDWWDTLKYGLALWNIMAPELRREFGMPMERIEKPASAEPVEA